MKLVAELLGDGFGEEKYFSALVVELKPGISPGIRQFHISFTQ